jgi:hypothetical protein
MENKNENIESVQESKTGARGYVTGSGGLGFVTFDNEKIFIEITQSDCCKEICKKIEDSGSEQVIDHVNNLIDHVFVHLK